MKLHLGPKEYDLSFLRYLATVCLALICLLAPQQPSHAQADPSTPTRPLVTSGVSQKAFAKQVNALRNSVLPFPKDYLSTYSNPDLKPSALKPLVDAPVPSTASQVASVEQTFDVTLPTLPSTSVSSTTGIPTAPTPYYTDVTWSGDNTFLVFSAIATGDTHYHLYAILASGSPIGYSTTGTPIYVQQLTSGSNNERYPSLLGTDGSIAYCTDANSADVLQLVVAPFTSTNGFAISQANAVPQDPALEARHPFYGGQSIYFSGRLAGSSGPFDIFQVSISNGGTKVIQFTGGGIADNDNPTVSNAGYIAWDSNANGYTFNPTGAIALTTTSVLPGNQRNIYVATLAGQGEQPLTEASASYTNEHPTWTTGSQNSFTTVGSYDLFFDSNRPSQFGNAAAGTFHIYYFGAFANNAPVTEASGNANPPVTQLNTSDPSGYAASVNHTGLTNQFQDMQPAVSQLQSPEIAVAYITNRYLITHNNDNPVLLSSLHNPTTVATANAQVTLGMSTALTSAVSAGATSLPVTGVTGTGTTSLFYQGQLLYIDQGTPNFEAVTVTSTPAPGATSISVTATAEAHESAVLVIAASAVTTSATAVGATSIPVVSANGFMVGQTVEIDRGLSTQEFAVVTAIITGANPSLTVNPLAIAHTSGAAVTPTVDVEPTSVLTVPTSEAGKASEIFISRLQDVSPPSIVRYNENDSEIVHVLDGPLYNTDGTTNYIPSAPETQYVPAGKQATFIVRLSDRQTGLGQVFLQIKDPNSFSQNSTGLEHKVFSQFRSAQFHPQLNEATLFDEVMGASSSLTSGPVGGLNVNHIRLGNQVNVYNSTATLTSNAFASNNPVSFTVSTLANPATGGNLQVNEMIDIQQATNNAEIATITGINTNTRTITVAALQNNHFAGSAFTFVEAYASQSGATTAATYTYNVNGFPNVGDLCQEGNDFFEVVKVTAVSTTGETIDVDKAIAESPSTLDYAMPIAPEADKTTIYLLGKAQIDPFGNEIDCQAIDTNIPANFNGLDVISSQSMDYHIPDFLPGISDAATFDDAMSNDTTGAIPSYWLKMQPLPANLQDDNGGVLYYGTWTTPETGSDFNIDVIAEDNSVNMQSVGTTDQSGENWRIYDNVWGFNTLPFLQKNRILVVNDYALPQRFFSRSGSNGPGNQFGTESYWTDINNDVIDWETYFTKTPAQQIAAQDAGTAPPTVVLPMIAQETAGDPSGVPQSTARAKLSYGYPYDSERGTYYPAYTNGLGINSYFDVNVGQVTTAGLNGPANNQTELPACQEYDIWRILSRGPVPQNILTSYGATTVTTPGNPFTATTSTSTVTTTLAPITTVSAPDCVVWLSPYSGDAFVGGGTITDPTTQAALSSFIDSGGRLHIEGKDIGYALTANGGQTNTFYNTYLNDGYSGQSFVTDDVGFGTNVFVLTPDTAATDRISTDAFPGPFPFTHDYIFPSVTANATYKYNPPSSSTYGGQLIVGNDAYSPFAVPYIDERTDASLDSGSSSSSFMDGFNTNATNAMSGTTNREAYYVNATTGGIVSYSSFGMAAVSQDVTNYVGTFPGAPTIPDFTTYNQRSHLEHNIVCALRTGTISGTISNLATGGQGLPGVIVVATLTNGTGVFTGETNTSGSYTIVGLTPGEYSVATYKAGFVNQHAAGNGVIVHGGDVAQLNLSTTPTAPGTLKVTVVDSSGNPVSGATVTLTEVTGGTSPNPVQTDVTGVASFSNVPAGIYSVTASAAGFTTVTSPTTVTITAGTASTLTITLTSLPTTITGKVVVAGTSTPIPGAILTLTNSSGAPFGTTTFYTATAASDGTFTLNVPAGVFTSASSAYISGVAPGYAPSAPPVAITSGTFTLGTNTYANVQVPLTASPSLAVVVVDALTHKGVNGIVVSATGTSTFPTQTTGPSGLVQFQPILTGSYTVNATTASIQSAGYLSAAYSPSATVSTTAGTTTTVTVTLLPAVGNLTGTVTSALTGNPISGAVVTVYNGTTVVNTATTDSNGNYTIADVPAGTFTATAAATSYQTSSPVSITITDGGTTTQSFSLTVPSIHNFPAGLQMISLPYDYTGVSLSSYLVGDYDSTTGNSNVIATWNPLTDTYVKTPTAPADGVHAGVGYWARFRSPSGGFVTQAGTVLTTSQIALSPGWNMIGDPFTTPVSLSNLTFFDSRGQGDPNNGGAAYTFAQASGAGGLNLISPYLYTYDQSTNSYSLVALGSTNGSTSSSLAPFTGYWIQAYSNCTLIY